MTHARCLAIGAWIAALLFCGTAEAQTRIGVIATETAETVALTPLVELGLGKDPNTVLVERNLIKEVLREQTLQAMMAADAPGKRAAMGKALKADLLVFLAGVAKPAPHVIVVVSETQQGLRLCSEPVLLTNKPEDDADAVHKLVEAAAKKRQEKIADIVAVPPLVNNSLTHEADQLQGAFARLVEGELLRRPGVVVVELAEAKALAQEIVITGSQGIERRLPLYLLGEYRLEGAGDARRAQFNWRLLRGEKELDRRQEKDLSEKNLPDRLHQAAVAMVEKALGKSDTRSDPEAEARQLAQRARTFLAVGNWEEALAMAEASLLLKPDQPAVHGDALRAMLEFNDARPCMKQRLLGGLSPQETIEVTQWLRVALPHLEGFFRGTKVDSSNQRWYIYRKWGAFRLGRMTPESREACMALRRDMRGTAQRILAAKAAAKTPDDSVRLLWEWTEPPFDAPADDAGMFLWYLTEWRYSDSLKPVWRVWLTSNLPEMCENRLKLLQDFLWLTGQGPSPSSNACLDLIPIREPGMAVPPLITDPLYVEFLGKVQKLPDLRMQNVAKNCLEEIRLQPQKAKEREERIKQLDEKRKIEAAAKQPKPPVADPDVVFRRLALTESSPSGQRKALVVSAPTRPATDGNSVWREIDTWIPVCAGCDLVLFRQRLRLSTQGSEGYVDTTLAVMKEKGHLRTLPLTVARTNSGASMWDDPVNACWDGEYFWALTPGEKGPLAVVEPRSEKIWTSGPEAGLPPATSCAMAPLGHGKICVAGYFGRLWVALATFDGNSIKLEVIHEARELPSVERGGGKPDDRQAVNLAFPISFVATLVAPAADRPQPRQRVLVNRLLVDPETRSVTSLSDVPFNQDFFFRDKGAVYWRGPQGGKEKGLYRTGFPDFKKEPINPVAYRGACVYFEGQYHMIDLGFRRYCVTHDLKEPWRRLECDIPGKCYFSKLALSNHYGLLLLTNDGTYTVELKKP